MADGRMLRKKASRDDRLAQLSDRSALLYVLSIPHLDVEGRMIGMPELVRGTVVPAFARLRPLDWTDQHVTAYIYEWTSTVDRDGCIDPLVLWYATDGESVLLFRGFGKNQNVRRDREQPSRLPAPPPELLEQPALAIVGVTLANPHGCTPGAKQEVEVEALSTGLSFAPARANEVEPKSLQIAHELERAREASALRAANGFGDRPAGTMRDDALSPDDFELQRIFGGLRGADNGTLHQLKVWRRKGCREREFAVAMESLATRRRSGRRLDNEARYFCQVLSNLLREREEAVA